MLTKLLETACAQTLTASEYEVIIVDNASTDNTRSLVESFSQRYTHVRYILEERLGASHARNRGWRDAKGQYIAFTDDDCRLPQDWLAKAKKIVIERSLDIFGGPYYSCFETTKPRWFRNTYCSLVHFEKTKKLNTNRHQPKELVSLTQ